GDKLRTFNNYKSLTENTFYKRYPESSLEKLNKREFTHIMKSISEQLLLSLDETRINSASNFFNIPVSEIVPKLHSFLNDEIDVKEIISEQNQYIIFATNEEDKRKEYNIEDIKNSLFTELYKINPFNDKEIFKFAKYFGLPSETTARQTNIFELKEKPKTDTEVLTFKRCYKISVIRDIVQFKNAFDFWITLKYKDEEFILNLAKKYRNYLNLEENEIIDLPNFSETDIYFESLIKKELFEYALIEDPTLDHLDQILYAEDPYLNESLTNLVGMVQDRIETNVEEIINELNNYFLSFINNYLFKYTTSIIYRENTGQYNIKFLYPDLYAAAYKKLSEAIVEDSYMKVCKNCGFYFEETHGKQTFCPPLPGVKR